MPFPLKNVLKIEKEGREVEREVYRDCARKH